MGSSGEDKSTVSGSVDLFFGCRHETHDWLYRTEMEELKQDGTITTLHTAFSRDGNKKYVQDLMREDQELASRLVSLLLEKQGVIYVCGDGNAMSKDVQKTIVDLLSEKLFVSTEEASSFLNNLKQDKRYLQDIWST